MMLDRRVWQLVADIAEKRRNADVQFRRLAMSLVHEELGRMQKQGKTVAFVAGDVYGLQKAYDRAVKNGAETFTFRGDEYFVGYAKYLLVYLREQFGLPRRA